MIIDPPSPKISVIIPTYNTPPRLLKICIDSVLAQKFRDKYKNPFEIILVDDGSDEVFKKDIDEWEKHNKYADSPIRVIRSKRNRGASAARNLGIDAARGDYVMFLDSDDKIGAKLNIKIKNKEKVKEGKEAPVYVKEILDDIDVTYLDTFLKNAGQAGDLVIGPTVMQKPGTQKYVNKIEQVRELESYYDDENRNKKRNKNNRVDVYDKAKMLAFVIRRQTACATLYSRKLLNDNNLRFNDKLTYVEDILFVASAMLKAEITATATVPHSFYLYQRRADSLMGKLKGHGETDMRLKDQYRDSFTACAAMMLFCFENDKIEGIHIAHKVLSDRIDDMDRKIKNGQLNADGATTMPGDDVAEYVAMMREKYPLLYRYKELKEIYNEDSRESRDLISALLGTCREVLSPKSSQKSSQLQGLMDNWINGKGSGSGAGVRTNAKARQDAQNTTGKG